jgi:hypothetical protein
VAAFVWFSSEWTEPGLTGSRADFLGLPRWPR